MFMSNIGRNEPCPCGSGKKYKKCCLLKEDEFASRQREKQSAAPRALDWLSTRYPKEVAEAVHYDFFGEPDDEEMQAINELPPHLQEMLQVNIGEWTLADAHLEIDGERKPVHELLLGPGGPLLPAAGRDWSLDEFEKVTPAQIRELAAHLLNQISDIQAMPLEQRGHREW